MTEFHFHPDGSIDFDFYRRRAMRLRRSATRSAVRKACTPRRLAGVVLYAAAFAGGIAYGAALPIPSQACRTCPVVVKEPPLNHASESARRFADHVIALTRR